MFSGLRKKTPKEVSVTGYTVASLSVVAVIVCIYILSVFVFFKDKDDQKELTASNDSLSENSHIKVLCM